MGNEIWKPVKGYEGLYEISNLGRVKSLNRIRVYGSAKLTERILKQNPNKKGYFSVKLYLNGASKSYPVHRLVAFAFLEEIEGKTQIDHIDGNNQNNESTNLRWVTAKENCNNPTTLIRRKGRKSHMAGKKGIETPMYGIKGVLNKRSIPVVSVKIDTGEVAYYENAYLAAQVIRGSFGNIRNCCKGRAKTHKGYKWYDTKEYEKIKQHA